MPLSSLNGWQRLGVFVGTLIAVPSFLIGYQDNKSAYVYYDVPERLQSLDGQKFTDQVYWDARSKNDELKGCMQSTARIEGHRDYSSKWSYAMITCDKTTERAIVDSFWYAAVPFMVVFGFGYVFAWIAAGFRQSRKTKTN